MPCSDNIPDSYGEVEKLHRRIDFLAQLLCGVCHRIENLDKEGNIASWSQILRLIEKDPALSQWWQDHKTADAKRREKERAEKERRRKRKAALAKLTPEERKLLGIKA